MVGDKAKDKHWGNPEQWALSRRVSKTLLLFFFLAAIHPCPRVALENYTPFPEKKKKKHWRNV